MFVRPSTTSKEKETMESLSQDGETEEEESEEEEKEKESEEEDEEEVEPMADNSPPSEGRASVGRQSPKMPTEAEKEEHSRTHCPYRSWCPHCVRPRARNHLHKKCVEDDPLEDVRAPRAHLGYFSMSREDEKASKNPLLVMADERTGSRYARAVGCKGTGENVSLDWLIEDVSSSLKSWGHTGGREGELIMKSDGEPVLVALKDAVMQYHGGINIPEYPAKGKKAEHGLIEEAGETVREYACTFISQIEAGAKGTPPLNSNLHLWLVRWAAVCYSRYAVGKDGRTAYERLRGRTCKAIVVPMGEKVWYKKSKGLKERIRQRRNGTLEFGSSRQQPALRRLSEHHSEW